jgi:hypothetical protein
VRAYRGGRSADALSEGRLCWVPDFICPAWWLTGDVRTWCVLHSLRRQLIVSCLLPPVVWVSTLNLSFALLAKSRPHSRTYYWKTAAPPASFLLVPCASAECREALPGDRIGKRADLETIGLAPGPQQRIKRTGNPARERLGFQNHNAGRNPDNMVELDRPAVPVRAPPAPRPRHPPGARQPRDAPRAPFPRSRCGAAATLPAHRPR